MGWVKFSVVCWKGIDFVDGIDGEVEVEAEEEVEVEVKGLERLKRWVY